MAEDSKIFCGTSYRIWEETRDDGKVPSNFFFAQAHDPIQSIQSAWRCYSTDLRTWVSDFVV